LERGKEKVKRTTWCVGAQNDTGEKAARKHRGGAYSGNKRHALSEKKKRGQRKNAIEKNCQREHVWGWRPRLGDILGYRVFLGGWGRPMIKRNRTPVKRGKNRGCQRRGTWKLRQSQRRNQNPWIRKGPFLQGKGEEKNTGRKGKKD